MNDKQARMQAADQALGIRPAKQTDPLRVSAARLLDAVAILGIFTWIGWAIHTVAGWFG